MKLEIDTDPDGLLLLYGGVTRILSAQSEVMEGFVRRGIATPEQAEDALALVESRIGYIRAQIQEQYPSIVAMADQVEAELKVRFRRGQS